MLRLGRFGNLSSPFEAETVTKRNGEPRRVRADGKPDQRGRRWAGQLPPNFGALKDARWGGDLERRPGELTLSDIRAFLSVRGNPSANWRALRPEALERAGIKGRESGVVFGRRVRRFYTLEQAKEILRLFHSRRRPGRAKKL